MGGSSLVQRYLIFQWHLLYHYNRQELFAMLLLVFLYLIQLTKETGALENVDLSEPLDIAEDIIKYSKEVLIKLESTLS